VRRLSLLASRPWHVTVAAAAAGLALAETGDLHVLACAAAGFAGLCVLRAPGLAAVVAIALPAGAAAGELRLAAIDAPAQRIRDGARVELTAELSAPPRPSAFGSSAEVRVVSERLRGARLLARVPRWAPLPRGVAVGERLRLEGRLAALAPGTSRSDTHSGEREGERFDFAAYLRRRGVAAELMLDRARRTGQRRGGLAGGLDAMRARAERAVDAGMPASDGALLRGMALGQDEAIDAAVREDFRASGLAHLLAVSGQNVMLLAALALPALALGGLGHNARLAALAALIALYVPLAGAGPSLQRAGVMGLAGIAAMVAARPASRWYALLLAAAGTLAWNPRAWADPGWQLSFAAVVGILAVGVPLGRVLRRAADELSPPQAFPPPAVRRAVADGVAITVAATLATAPLLAHHFGSVPLAGLPANVLALPAVAPAMWLGMLKIALGQIPALDPVAAALGPVAAVPVGYLAWLAERCADLPGGQLALPLGSPAAVLAAYAVMAAGALLVARTARPVGPRLAELAARWRRAPRTTRAVLVALAGVAALAGSATALEGPGPPAQLTVRFLDVGQGDATLIQHPDGTAVLFDGGPPEAGVARLLRRAGVERLAIVVATHASRDHHGGLAEVLRRFDVAMLLDGGDGSADPGFRAVMRGASARSVRRVPATAPMALTLAGGDLRIRILSPPPRPPGPAPEDPNPRAVVAIVSAGGFDLLLSADAESETLLPLDLPDVEAMKVPHHGSADPGLAETLDRLDPELAAIEVGPNTYGHPTPSTLAALDRAGVRTFRTDRHGTVTLALHDEELRVETER
jgi:competence protein ComEC